MNNKEMLKFGQMLMIGLDVTEINDEIIELIQKYKIGGVVLYKKNYDSVESMIKFINQLKEINNGNEPLFIAIDQENGRVNRLPLEIKRIYNPKRQTRTKDLSVIDECNEITSKILSNVGVNMNFAPVLDINRDNSSIVGNRSYGMNKDDVIKYGLPMMKKLQEKGIISVIKHFPGHGIVHGDSHYVIPIIKNIKKMENEDLEVFHEALNNGADAVMVGHLRIKGHGFKPATINDRIINDYLINKFNYDGLIVTDDLKMNLMKYIYGTKNIICHSINANCNVLMVKYKKGDIKRLYSKLYKMILNNKIDNNKINNSYDKIINIKKKYNLSNTTININIDVDEINKQIDNVNMKM